MTLVVTVSSAAGCYSLKPVVGPTLLAGSVISLSINDAGRAALAGQMGSGVSDVEGRLVQRDSAGYLLAIAQVQTLQGSTQVWSGERVQINNEFVNVAREKRFSRSKTALVSASAVALIAILASQGILGSLAGDEGKNPPDTSITIKIPLFTKR